MLNLWHEMKARSRSVEGYVCTPSRTTSRTYDTRGLNAEIDQFVVRRRLRPDVVAYTTLIDSLGHNGDIERMISTFAEMKHEAALEEQRLKEEKEQRALNMEIEPLSTQPLRVRIAFPSHR
jgi:pentatricopeptide repeat protein